jgi:chromosome segregation ATPase
MASEVKSKSSLDIEQLKKKHKELERRKTTAEADLRNATQQLDALREEAKQKYGTADLDELRARLAEMKQSNEKKRSDYQKHLEEIEIRLAQVEKEFANPPAAAGQDEGRVQ